MTTIEKIRAEIERQIKDPQEHCYGVSSINKLRELLDFIDTLESERPEPYNPVYDEAYLNEKIKKATESWKGEDVDAMLAEFRGYDEEKSEKQNQEELDKEIEEYFPESSFYTGFNSDDVLEIARHFAQWGAEHTPLPEDTVLFNKGVEEGKRLMMEDAVKWLVDDDYHEASEKGRFILGSVGLGYNGYYIPYLDLLKLPKED